MPRIKHIAISTHEPEKTAKFYEEVMGMKVVARNDYGDTDAVFMSDGYINLALLHFKTDEAALCENGTKFIGLHHIGFLMEDDVENKEVLEKLDRLKAPFLQGGPLGAANVYAEIKVKDPNGVTLDISEGGWPGTGR
jgi:methylmalonyl-CoA/ethylmalonyl-CoA epimerase